MEARSSGWSLRFSVWRIAPTSGAAKYVSRCRVWFHIKVATRSPLRSPSFESASASARERRCTSRQVVRCTDLSGCRETTSTSGKYLAARSISAGTRSGPSIIVPRMWATSSGWSERNKARAAAPAQHRHREDGRRRGQDRVSHAAITAPAVRAVKPSAERLRQRESIAIYP